MQNIKYGYFSNKGDEYIITTPYTPRPWVNYLTNGDYTALCSHIGGGFSFYKDHRYNSVLQRGQFAYQQDSPARFIYVKDEETGEIWTVNALPIGKFDSYEATHGLGYTIIKSSYGGISATVRYSVPIGVDAETWEVDIVNNSGRSRRISVYSAAEILMGNVSLDEVDNFFMALFNQSGVEENRRDIKFVKRWWHPYNGWSEENGNWDMRLLMTTSVEPTSVTTSRELFLGAFNDYKTPAALDMETLPQSESTSGPIVASYQWRVTLDDGESFATDIALAVVTDNTDEDGLLKKLRCHDNYADMFENTKKYWDNMFDGFEVTTPDSVINNMVNYWNKWQIIVNFTCGRGPSYYHKGQYQGMRDSCQDAFGVIALSPQYAKEGIRRIASFFYSDGRCAGGCNRIGIKEPAADKADLPLWITLSVMNYLRETGDLDFLDEEIPLIDGGSSTVYEKMTKGVERMLDTVGEHGLPLIGHGDWNDAANRIGAGGKGESVWLAQFVYFVLNELIEVAKLRCDNARVENYKTYAENIYKRVNESCWDDEWFIRAFKDNGEPVGVKGQKEGFIWVNSQTWAAISNISTPERLNMAMDSVNKYLSTDYGLMNLGPAYSEIDEEIGLITRFTPGWKENGAVFSHASAFNVVGRAVLGRGDDAVDLYTKLMPALKDPDKYLMEPYVFSQFCVGPAQSLEHGRGAYHWLTGTAAWMLRAMGDYIIGVRPTFDGLLISPAVSSDWKEFSMKRKFRNAVYNITFVNSNGQQNGVKEIYLDNEKIEGNTLPIPTKEIHNVKVIM